jgi:hypothetical protein
MRLAAALRIGGVMRLAAALRIGGVMRLAAALRIGGVMRLAAALRIGGYAFVGRRGCPEIFAGHPRRPAHLGGLWSISQG